MGVLPDLDSALATCSDLEAARVDLSAAQLLHGVEGARILDPSGTEHGYKERLLRFFQSFGFEQNVLAVYEEGLNRGGALLTIHCTRDEAGVIAGHMTAHGGHAINYYGDGTLEHLGPVLGS